jgi:hypothetical protein
MLIVVICGVAVAAHGATSITEPTGNPYQVPLDAQGNVVPFTVVAKGFPPNSNVFVMQCDGRHPSDPNWSPDRDCDSGTSPPPAIADASGTVRFDAANPNRRLVVVKGPSPQGIFNCVPQGTKAPNNLVRSFTTCQIRVSTNNAQPTADQVFVPIVFGSRGSSSSSSSSNTWKVVVVAVAVVVLLAIGGGLLLVRRRAADRA